MGRPIRPTPIKSDSRHQHDSCPRGQAILIFVLAGCQEARAYIGRRRTSGWAASGSLPQGLRLGVRPTQQDDRTTACLLAALGVSQAETMKEP